MSPVWELAQAWVWVVAGLLVVVPQELASAQVLVWDWELLVQVDQALQAEQVQASVQVGGGGVVDPDGKPSQTSQSSYWRKKMPGSSASAEPRVK